MRRIEGAEEGGRQLVPLLDLSNHSQRPSAEILKDEESGWWGPVQGVKDEESGWVVGARAHTTWGEGVHGAWLA